MQSGILGGGNATNSFYGHLVQGKTVYYLDDFDGDGNNALVKSPELYAEEGPWDSETVNAVGSVNEDFHLADAGTFRVDSLKSLANPNDALVFATASETSNLENNLAKVNLTYTKTVDYRGFLVSNGRKFWLQQHGTYVKVLDLGSDSFLGMVWKGAKIATNRIMLTNSSQPPRILHLDRVSTLAGDETFAGCISPEKPEGQEQYEGFHQDDVIRQPSWIMEAFDTDSGFLQPKTETSEPTRLWAMVRGVNLVDGIASNFVRVTSGTVPDTTQVQTGVSGVDDAVKSLSITHENSEAAVCVQTDSEEGQGVDVGSNFAAKGSFTPPIHSRITHIEIWRTQLSGTNVATVPGAFYLESRILIADLEFNEMAFDQNGNRFALIDGNSGVGPSKNRHPIRLGDSDLLKFPPLSDIEFVSNGLPPICQDVLSLSDVTFCFGKSDSAVSLATLFGINFRFGETGYDGLNDEIDVAESTGQDLIVGTKGYVQKKGDKLVFVYGGSIVDGALPGPPTNASHDLSEVRQFPEQEYFAGGVASNGSALEAYEDEDLENKVLFSVPTSAGDKNLALMYLKRPYSYEYPKVQDDEELWYSRTDAFGPESFPKRIFRLSSQGDIYRKAVNVGNGILVVMDQGVHFLRLDDNNLLRKDTVEQFGAGTPWPNSVVVEGTRVHWLTTQGINTVNITPEPNVEGQRAILSRDHSLRFEGWLKETLDEGYSVDAGFDSRNGVIRFRRSKDNEFQVLALSLRTKRVALFDDDRGFHYVQSSVAESEGKTVFELYSVDATTGAVFQVYNNSEDLPYGGAVIQDNLFDYVIGASSILSVNENVFSSKMVGDVIRFRDSDGDEVSRVILTATEKKLTFATVTDIKFRKVFLIGPVRFRLKPASLSGESGTTVKNIHKVTLKARPGERGEGEITIKSFADFSEDETSEEIIEAFNDDAPRKTSQDRVASIEAQGNEVEIALESLDTDNDFEIESLEVIVKEEVSEQTDSEEN
jgi:hypothetical protein